MLLQEISFLMHSFSDDSKGEETCEETNNSLLGVFWEVQVCARLMAEGWLKVQGIRTSIQPSAFITSHAKSNRSQKPDALSPKP